MECYEWILIIKQYIVYHRAADIFWCGSSGEKISWATALPSYDCRMQLTSHSRWDHIIFPLYSRTILVAKWSKLMARGNIMKTFRLVPSQESGFGILCLIFKSKVKHSLLWAVPSSDQNSIFNLLLLTLLLWIFLTSTDLHQSQTITFKICSVDNILQKTHFF